MNYLNLIGGSMVFLRIGIFFAFLQIHSCYGVFPDYRDKDDQELIVKFKHGCGQIIVGTGTEFASQYVSTVSWNQHYFNEHTMRGMGNAMIINGGVDAFFALKEIYSRYHSKLTQTQKGIFDIVAATVLYGASYHMPDILNASFVQLGGQGGCILAYSVLAVRGVTDLSEGLVLNFVELDCCALANKSLKYTKHMLGNAAGAIASLWK